MNAAAARREDRALIRAFSRSVFVDRELVGRIHPGDNSTWIGEFHGRPIGVYASEALAVRGVLQAAKAEGRL